MNKKQFGIIFTLLGLVVCVGLLATKLNSGGLNLNDPSDLASIAPTDEAVISEGEVSASEKGDFFYESRSEREKKDEEVIQSLKAVVEDKNTSKEQKDKAQNELLRKTNQKNNENRVEINVKNKGFKDALCYIEGDRAKVFVKSDKGLDEKASIQIQEVVQDVASINDVSIEAKK